MFFAESLVWWRLYLCWRSTPLQGLLLATLVFEKLTNNTIVCLHFSLPVCYNCQVERGKQAYYCYDDADLKEVQRSFPHNASYNIQRFKGKNKISFPLSFSFRLHIYNWPMGDEKEGKSSFCYMIHANDVFFVT